MGKFLFRASKLGKEEGCPSNVSRLRYPPADKADLGRCNKEGIPVFYTAAHDDIAFLEAGLEKGDRFVFSKWRIQKKFISKPIGYSAKEAAAFIKNSEEAEYWLNNQDASFDYINKYFNDWFTCKGNTYYEITSLISNAIINRPIVEAQANSQNLHERMAVLYRSMAYRRKIADGNADNVALSAKAVNDGVVVPVEAAFCLVNDASDTRIDYYTDDTASSIVNGRINWSRESSHGKAKIIRKTEDYS